MVSFMVDRGRYRWYGVAVAHGLRSSLTSTEWFDLDPIPAPRVNTLSPDDMDVDSLRALHVALLSVSSTLQESVMLVISQDATSLFRLAPSLGEARARRLTDISLQTK
jgi:hypothetical protein